MKKIIERLERIKIDLDTHCITWYTLELLDKALAELKASPRRNSEGERRVQCNWCESVFDEEHIKVRDDIEYCPVCGDSEYFMDLPEAESKPRWETPEQWEKRTGEAWPEGWAVYVLVRNKYTREKEYRWETFSYYATRPFRGHNPIVCATEAGKPPKSWRPETENGQGIRRCRVCGCTDDDCHQCIEKTGKPCHWVEEDLCSACADVEQEG